MILKALDVLYNIVSYTFLLTLHGSGEIYFWKLEKFEHRILGVLTRRIPTLLSKKKYLNIEKKSGVLQSHLTV
jgi:hypothetical protein